MPVPNPTMPVKGAGTTLWVYKGNGDPYANPLSDVDWSRLAKVKDLTPGELTAESYDDSYLDDEDADWTATGQGQKSAGDTSFTLAWMPGEQGQQALLAWFNEGDTRAYKIRFPNGTVDVFRGWVSSIGKAVTAKEVITRTVKVTNVGRPSMAEDRSTVTAATGMTVTPASASVVKGQSTTLTVAFQPEGATDKSFRAVSADKTKATVSVSGMTITVNGVAAGKVNIPVVSGNGEFAAVAEITVKRMPKPAKLRRKTVRMQQPKARVLQLVLQARRLLLPLHQPTVKKQQKPVKPMQRQARLQRRTRRKHRQQARQQLKQVKTQPESMQVRQQSRINMSYSHCLMCGYRLTIHWI